MLRLKQLRVKGVRGIVDGPDLFFETGGLLLCGDNGTGKSSYVDAVEKVLAGKCSSLDIGARGVSWRKQGTHVNCQDSEVELTLTDGPQDIILTLGTDPATLDKQTRIFLEAARQQSFILRRRTLLDFIDTEPRKRYQAIESFLNLDEFASFEAKLKDLEKTVEAKLTVACESRDQHERTLREQLGLDKLVSIDDATCLQAVNETLGIARISAMTSLGDITSTLAKLESLLTPYKNMEALQKVQLLVDSIERIPDVADLLKAAQEYTDARRKFVTEEAKLKGHFYVQVLEKGLAWIAEDDLSRCPLCNNPVTLPEVTAYVDMRLAENKKFIQLKQRQSRARSIFEDSWRTWRDSFESVRNQWIDALNSDFPDEAIQIATGLEQLLESHATLLPVSTIERDIGSSLEGRFVEVAKSLGATAKRRRDSFPDSVRYSQLYNAKLQASATSIHFKEITELNRRISYLETCNGQLRVLSDLAEKSRKKAVQKLLDEIVEIADQYIQRIHPSERIGNPKLTIPERGSGSIDLTSHFHSETGDPRGHYSEGHVDSLGLCLFLAIRRIHHTQHPELSLLILDDVLHSVDANHRRETANLIFEEFKDHQVIVTTHDSLWFEYLKLAARNNNQAKFIQRRIASWTLDTGPIWGDHLSNYEWLVSSKSQKAKPADKVIKAGLLLEEMLQNLCNNLWVSVPFRIRGDYTIDPLWTSFYATIRKKNKEFSAKAESCLKEIDDLRNLRNWVGAHWNEWAQTLTNSEAGAFAKAVLELREYAYCEDCRQFVRRIPELDGVWSCKRECKRYSRRQRTV